MKLIFKNIGIVLRIDTPEIHENSIHIIKYLLQNGKHVYLDSVSFTELNEENYLSDDLGQQIINVPLNELGGVCDVVLVIGGDGTLLTVARNVVDYDVPIVGINRGRLGFLTQVSWQEAVLEIIASILSGQYIKETRTMLLSNIIRQGSVVSRSLSFNEVAISRGGLGHMIEFEVFINGEFVYLQYSDGLIVATPTGSTAYSLAAGGPILHATLAALTLVPICPQSMSNRPVVVSDQSDIDVLIVKGYDARVHCDGQSSFELKNMDTINIKKHNKSITILQPVFYRYFNTLRQKLRWGEQLV